MAPGDLSDAACRIATGFGRARGIDGLLAGIEHLAGALATTFPRASADVNELPDAPDLDAARSP